MRQMHHPLLPPRHEGKSQKSHAVLGSTDASTSPRLRFAPRLGCTAKSSNPSQEKLGVEASFVKVFIIYDSKYGNTKMVAENILVGLKQVEGVEAAIGYVKQVDCEMLVGYDALVFGAPNHMGKPSRTMTKFVDSISQAPLNAKWAAAFDTYFQRQRYFEKAMKKLEKHVKTHMPNLTLIAPGLSVRVHGVNGPVVEGELAKAQEFGKKLVIQIKEQQSPKSN
jgi:menaquinone-dependent protoporphyrinogen IX oxidase